jgi:hypothetical protein
MRVGLGGNERSDIIVDLGLRRSCFDIKRYWEAADLLPAETGPRRRLSGYAAWSELRNKAHANCYTERDLRIASGITFGIVIKSLRRRGLSVCTGTTLHLRELQSEPPSIRNRR